MNPSSARWQPWRRAALVTAAVVALLLGCGGVGSGGTGSFASGPITGFGSIIVGGVHFDESAARIEGDDGSTRSATELQLGTVVEVYSGEVVNAEAQASQVRLVSTLIGRVDAVDEPASRLTVNGLGVRVHAATVFDAQLGGGLAVLAVGDVVEVYGPVDGVSGEVSASRVEPHAGATAYKFRGEISGLDRTARRFRIGAEVFDYGAIATPPAELADGTIVRATVDLSRNGAGRWPVRTLATASPPQGDLDDVRVNGLINRFASAADFHVQGVRVDASAASITGGPLARGQRVAVDGMLRAGVLQAARVSVQPEDGGGDIEMRGVIASVDAAGRTFAFAGRRERVSFASADIDYEGGDASSIIVGRRVKVAGRLSADGTLVEARAIEFPN